jgi:glycosyltransferase involved in cell wall biosynthesis
VCRGAVAAAVRETGAMFGAIGSQATARVLGIPASHAVWRQWTSIEDYPEAVASLDVGIAPLMDSAFNRAKSFLKGLEYAALSVPFVHSPLPEYIWLGAGVPAHNPRVWERELKRLLTDEAWRIELAEQGRERASGLTYEAHCGRWWDAWELAGSYRQRPVSKWLEAR